MDPAILEAGMWYLAFVFSTTCHEAAHAFAARSLGDDTAERAGLCTLNPIPHMMYAPFGMVILPLALIALTGRLFGWGMAPYSPIWADRFPKRAALMALAGPAANLVLAALACLTLRQGLALGWFALGGGPLGIGAGNPGWQSGLATMCMLLLLLNAMLFVLNLMPVPPFDGAALVTLLLPHQMARNYRERLLDPNAQLLTSLVALYLFSQVVARHVADFALWCVVA